MKWIKPRRSKLNLLSAVEEAIKRIKSSNSPHFRYSSDNWKVLIKLISRKKVIIVKVRDEKELGALKVKLNDKRIRYEHARRIGGKRAPDRIYIYA